MNAYVWRNTRPVSSMFHDNGGLLIVAESLEDARQEATAQLTSNYGPDYTKAEWWDDAPDFIWSLVDAEPVVLAFPDGGCCG